LRESEEDGGLSIEQRARQYIADMRRVQPKGPYRIAGWCAAGPLAVEISRQLILAGDEVALLELFDSWLPGYADQFDRLETAKSVWELVSSKYLHYKKAVDDLSLFGRFKYLRRVLNRMLREARDQFYIDHWSGMNSLSKKLRIPLPQFMHNTTLQTFAAMKEFREESIPVRITLIRAQDSRQVPGALETCGWERIAELGVEVLWVPGDHETMFRGHNLAVTAKLVGET
jgi:thioesterase domain-containing protein